MAIWKGDIKINEQDIKKEQKELKKQAKKDSKIFGSSKKERDRLNALPGKRESSDIENFSKKLETKSSKDNKESLFDLYQSMERSSEDSLESEKNKANWKNPLKLLKEVYDAKEVEKELKLQETYDAGISASVFKSLKDLFGKRAQKYISEHKEDRNLDNVKNRFNNIINTYKTKDGKVNPFAVLDKTKNKDTKEIDELFEDVFGYVKFKTAMLIADKDISEEQTNVHNNVSKLVGGINTGVSSKNIEGGVRERELENVKALLKDEKTFNKIKSNFQKNPNDSRLQLMYGIKSAKELDLLKYLVNFDDLMQLYKACGNIESNELLKVDLENCFNLNNIDNTKLIDFICDNYIELNKQKDNLLSVSDYNKIKNKKVKEFIDLLGKDKSGALISSILGIINDYITNDKGKDIHDDATKYLQTLTNKTDVTLLKTLCFKAYLLAREEACYRDIKANTQMVDTSSLKQERWNTAKEQIIGASISTIFLAVDVVTLGFGSKISAAFKSLNIVKKASKGITTLSKFKPVKFIGKGAKRLFTNSGQEMAKEFVEKSVQKATKELIENSAQEMTKELIEKSLKETVRKEFLGFAKEQVQKEIRKTTVDIGSVVMADIVVTKGLESYLSSVNVSNNTKEGLLEFTDNFFKNYTELTVKKHLNKFTNVNAMFYNRRAENTKNIANMMYAISSVKREDIFNEKDFKNTDLSINNISQAISGKDFKDLFNLQINSDVFNYKITPKQANDIFYLIKLLNTMNSSNINSSGKEIRNSTHISNIANFTESLRNSLTEDVICKILGYNNKQAFEKDKKIIEQSAETIEKIKNKNLKIDDNDTINNNNDSYIEVTYKEPKLIEGWIRKDKTLAGYNAGDLPFIIKRVLDVDSKKTILQANIKSIPNNVVDNAMSSKIEFANIKKYSIQYFNWYNNASYVELTEDLIKQLKYCLFCLNDTHDYTWTSFEIFNSTMWDSDPLFEDTLRILFNICFYKDKFIMLSSSTSPTPDPEKETKKIRDQLINMVKDIVKNDGLIDDEEKSESIEIIDNVEKIIEFVDNSSKNDTIKLDKNKSELSSFLNESTLAVEDNAWAESTTEFIKKYGTEKMGLGKHDLDSMIEYSDINTKSETPYDTLMAYYNLLEKVYNTINSSENEKFNEFISNIVQSDISIDLGEGKTEKVNIYEGLNTGDRKFKLTEAYDRYYIGRYIGSFKTTFLSIIDYECNLLSSSMYNIFNPELVFNVDKSVSRIKNSNRNIYNSFNNMQKNRPNSWGLYNQLITLSGETLLLLDDIGITGKKIKSTKEKCDIISFNKKLKTIISGLANFEKYYTFTHSILSQYKIDLNDILRSLEIKYKKSLISLQQTDFWLITYLSNESLGGWNDLNNKAKSACSEGNNKKFYNQWYITCDQIFNSTRTNYIKMINALDESRKSTDIKTLLRYDNEFFNEFVFLFGMYLSCWIPIIFALSGTQFFKNIEDLTGAVSDVANFASYGIGIGATIGSIIPGAGTAVGGWIGAGVGAIIGLIVWSTETSDVAVSSYATDLGETIRQNYEKQLAIDSMKFSVEERSQLY